jgi:hypothetical protein
MHADRIGQMPRHGRPRSGTAPVCNSRSNTPEAKKQAGPAYSARHAFQPGVRICKRFEIWLSWKETLHARRHSDSRFLVRCDELILAPWMTTEDAFVEPSGAAWRRSGREGLSMKPRSARARPRRDLRARYPLSQLPLLARSMCSP